MSKEPADNSKVKVLVVEDDAATAKTLCRLLEHYGYSVILAASIAQAVNYLTFQPQIVLLDLNLPDGEGTRVLEQIKLRGMSAKVAVVTAEMDESRLRRVRTFGPELLLHKPIDFLQLLEQIRIPRNAA